MPQRRQIPFEMISDFKPAGDQPKAIAELAQGLEDGCRFQTLKGITGSGKSATVAWTIEKIQRPTLVIAPNKSLAAQFANEMKEFFPNNKVEYFVSYYDYYQPEAYMPTSDTYIEKDSSVNEEIDRLRHSATSSLLTRTDVIVVASVSCIYGLGSPLEYEQQMLLLSQGDVIDQRETLARLIEMHYERNDTVLRRGCFSVRGDTIDIHPAYDETFLRVELWGDEIEQISVTDPLTGERLRTLSEVVIYPASHYVASQERLEAAIERIEVELAERLKHFESENKLLEAQRLRMRTTYDLEMLQEAGYCNGVENYSGPLDGRALGEAPFTLLNYFPENFVTIIDESHVAVPQLHGQFAGDRSRKTTLIEHGFRLPSAADNRPLQFEEVMERVGQTIFLSATPGNYELEHSDNIVEQIIRPTGLVDPEVICKPTKGQIDDLVALIRERTERQARVLVTTLTKKMAEDLSDYLLELGLRVRYLHSEVDTLERIQILSDLRTGIFDVLVGINLLREGLDLPEVSLVAILDADKEGFLRSETSLIQTIGRVARNVEGQVVMYADVMTDSMKRAIKETSRRRKMQMEHNQKHNIEPQTVRKAVTDILSMLGAGAGAGAGSGAGSGRGAKAPVPGKGRRRQHERDTQRLADQIEGLPSDDLERLILTLEEEMGEASAALRFEYAARLRDEIAELKRELKAMRQAIG